MDDATFTRMTAQGPDAVATTLEAWAPSLGRVTDMDTELARRIDAVVAAVGSSG